LTSVDAIRELEERKQTKPQRRAARVRRVVVEGALPSPAIAGAREAGEVEVADDDAYEGWRQSAALAMPHDVEDDVDLMLVAEQHQGVGLIQSHG
jgi:hypothetical protein